MSSVALFLLLALSPRLCVAAAASVVAGVSARPAPRLPTAAIVEPQASAAAPAQAASVAPDARAAVAQAAALAPDDPRRPEAVSGIYDGTAGLARERAYDMVVLGAGPAGLATALQARQLGLEVLVVEHRLRPSAGGARTSWGSRERVIAIDRDALRTLRMLGVEDLGHAPMTSYIIGRDGRQRLEIPQSDAASGLSRRLIQRIFGGTVPIGRLERALLDTAARAGIHVVFGAQAERVDSESVLVRDHMGATLEARTTHVVVAEGARSPTLAALAGPSRPPSDGAVTAFVGNFARADTRPGEYRIQIAGDGDQRYDGVALAHRDYTTVYASPYRRGGRADDPPDEVIRETARRLGIRGEYQHDAQPFEISLDRAPTFLFGNVLIIGDAARKADPVTGIGVSMAIGDALRVGKFLKRWSTRSPRERQRAGQEFQDAMSGSATIVRRQADIFNGIRGLLRSDNPVFSLGYRLFSRVVLGARTRR